MESGLLSIITILIAGEIVFLTIAFTTYYFIWNKNTLAKHTTPASSIPISTSGLSPQFSDQYWKEEIKRTQDTISSRNKNIIGTPGNIDLLALDLRLQMLQLEQQISLKTSDKRKIEEIESDIRTILIHMRLIEALNLLTTKPDKADTGDTIDSQKLIEEQKKTIAILKKYTREILDRILKQNAEFLGSQPDHEDIIALTNAHNEFLNESDSLIEKMEFLESQNTELYQCVAILEDENQFLRDQIASLLTIPDKKINA
jgi:hypothetical protein